MLLTSPLSSPLKNPVRDVFSPAGGSSLTAQVQALFAGRAGGMWDMGDIATLFQDAATPVTAVTQPIGMVLDKSQGLILGPELVTNGDFSGGTTGWVPRAGAATHAVVGGEMEVTAINTSAQVTEQSFSVVSGRTYKVTGTMRAAGTNSVANSARISINGATVFSLAQVSANGVQTPFSLFATANSSTFQVQLSVASLGAWGAIGDKAYFDNISIKEIPGNHATQPTAGSRSLYQVVSGYGCAQFDGVNDLLQVSGINLSATNKVLIGLAFKPNTTAASIAMEYSTTAVSNIGAFYVSINESGTGKHNMLANSGGSGLVDVVTLSSAVALAPTVLIDYIDLAQLVSTAKHSVRVNGASAGITSVIDSTDVAGNFGNYDLFLGARSGSSVPSNMNLYRAFVLAGSSTAGEQLILENWLRESCGV